MAQQQLVHGDAAAEREAGSALADQMTPPETLAELRRRLSKEAPYLAESIDTAVALKASVLAQLIADAERCARLDAAVKRVFVSEDWCDAFADAMDALRKLSKEQP